MTITKNLKSGSVFLVFAMVLVTNLLSGFLTWFAELAIETILTGALCLLFIKVSSWGSKPDRKPQAAAVAKTSRDEMAEDDLSIPVFSRNKGQYHGIHRHVD